MRRVQNFAFHISLLVAVAVALVAIIGVKFQQRASCCLVRVVTRPLHLRTRDKKVLSLRRIHTLLCISITHSVTFNQHHRLSITWNCEQPIDNAGSKRNQERFGSSETRGLEDHCGVVRNDLVKQRVNV